ncbi:MAG: RagB/SusD family nutrient uptake outer membrane protein, partial [Tannerellaceae bacterium]|nr:RagB/SusD family nutrient uptake outer membrane protein [Tannerellaceae bacterium]
LYEYIDWDGDGIAGNESDPSGERYLYFERDTLFIPQEGGTFKVQIESSVRYGYPKGPTDNIHEEPFYDLGIRDINWEDTLEDGYLEVKVSPASAFMIKCGSVIIESADRKLSATLVLKQEGDRDRLFPTEKVRQTYESILSRFYLSYSSNSTMEALYTGYNNSIDEWGWHEFADRTLNSSNSIIHEGYSSNYSAATNLYLVRKVLDQYVSKETEAIKSTFDCLFALSYYPLGILWENVVYAETPDDIESTLRAPQINFKELFTTFEPDMYKAMHVLPALQEGMIVISKNVPRGILGKMYIQTGEYVKAFEQFTAIIESGQYALEADVKQAYSNSSKELIYSFPNSQMQPYYTFIHATEQVPVITYTEVLLSAAECALKVGNSAQAQQYVEEVIRRKSNSGIILQIKNSKDLEPIWKEYLGGTFTYFAFLKRNGLAEDVLDIESFRTLFPIPFIELTVNPNILQNPGY